MLEVPVFPLPHVVLFPESLLPLHIFEPRYRAMLADCRASGGALVIAQLDSTGTRISAVAGLGKIVDHHPLPDGRSNIVVAGTGRVHLDELVPEAPPRYPYKRARVSRLDDLEESVNEADATALLATASMFAAEVKKHDPSFVFQLPRTGTTGPGMLADLCAFQLVIDAGIRQSILEELDPRARVRRVLDQIVLQHGSMISEAEGRVLN